MQSNIKRYLLFAIIIVFGFAAIISCSGGGDGTNDTITPTVNVTGNWSGTWSSSITSDNGTATVELLQNGTNITGTMSMTGSPCMSTGSITGTVSGSSVSFTAISGNDDIQVNGTVFNDTVTGNYSITTGLCAGDSGIFSLNKDSNVTTPFITTLVSGLFYPYDLTLNTVNTGYLFWSDDSQTPIKKVSLSDGNVTDLVNRLGDPEHLITSGQYLYWVGSGSVASVALGINTRTLNISTLDGNSTVVLAVGNPTRSEDIIVDDNNVYWFSSKLGTGEYTIEKVPLDGSALQILYSTSLEIRSMVRDATHLYWLEGGTLDAVIIKKMPLGGGEVSIVVDGTDIYNGFVGNIVLDGSDIYVAEVQYPYPGNARLLKFDVTNGAATIVADIPSFPKKLTVDETNIYWIDAGSYVVEDGEVNLIPKNGGSMTTLASGLLDPKDILLDSENVFWAESDGLIGRIKKVPISGGTVTTLIDEVDSPIIVTVNGPDIYWIEGGARARLDGFGRIAKMPINGGSDNTIISGIIRNMSLGWEGMPITADNTNVYFADRKTIKKVSHNGGPVEKLAIAGDYIEDLTTDGINVYWIDKSPMIRIAKVSINGGPKEILSHEVVGPSGRIIVNNGYVYWMAHYDTIAKVPIDGGLTEIVASDLPFLADFTVDDAYAYFSEWDTGRIRKVSLNDGTITELINLGPSASRRLAVDSYNLFWTDSYLGKIPVDGGSITVIDQITVCGTGAPNSVVVDDTSVYWTDVCSGEIKMAQPK